MPPITLLFMLLARAFSPVPAPSPASTPLDPLAPAWSAPLGPGFSAPAVTDDVVFASFRAVDLGAPDDAGAPGADGTATFVAAFELTTGSELWRTSFEDAPREGQEDYGGGTGPHATPVVGAERVFVLGYGGRLVALSRATGEPEWSVDLVEAYGAKPVQFGFAATPRLANGRLLVHVGGESGVIAFDAATGADAWRSAAADASYVSPLVASVDGAAQVVYASEDGTTGLAQDTGEQLWTLPHLRPDLTNYAMLVDLGGGSFLVSGQGNRGLRRIDAGRSGEAWGAEARWHARAVQFSHGGVVRQGGFVYGSNGSLLCGVRLDDGAVVFKERGFAESNLVAAGDWTVRIDEDGELSLLRIAPERIDVHARRKVAEPKTWAAPVFAGGRLFVRDGLHLMCFDLPALADLPEPVESLETGYEPDRIVVAPSQIALAHGTYVTERGRSIRLVAEDGALSCENAAGRRVPLEPQSDRIFEAPGIGRIELTGDEVRPTGLRLVEPAGTVAARLVAPELTPPSSEQVASLAGRWKLEGDITLAFANQDERFLARSSIYEGVDFRVERESDRRVWLFAENAGYGIPDILIELTDARLTIHQGQNTMAATR